MSTDLHDLLNPPEPKLPVRPADPGALPAPPATGEQPERSIVRALILGAVVVALVAGLVGFALGRASSSEAPATSPAAAAPSSSSTFDNWLPDCNVTPGPQCEVETAARRYMAARQKGEPLELFIAQGFKVPERAPRGALSRTPYVSMTNPTTAAVTVWTESDGMFVMGLTNVDGAWRVNREVG